MTTEDIDDRPIITSSTDQKAFKDMLVEATHSLRRIDDERAQLKDIIKAATEKFGIKPKLIRKLASTMYKHTYADIRTENEHFEYLYDVLIEGKKPTE